MRQYFNQRSLAYALNHPLIAIRSLRIAVAKPDAESIASLTTVEKGKVESYLRESQGNKELSWVFTNSVGAKTSSGMPRHALDSIYALVRALRPQCVVETGVSAGRSSTFILEALRVNEFGSLFSIDVPYGPEEVGCMIPKHLQDRWHLFLGSSEELLPNLLIKLAQVDMFLHDSEHSFENMSFEFGVARKHVREGGLILSHNVQRNMAFKELCISLGKNPTFVCKGDKNLGIVQI